MCLVSGSWSKEWTQPVLTAVKEGKRRTKSGTRWTQTEHAGQSRLHEVAFVMAPHFFKLGNVRPSSQMATKTHLMLTGLSLDDSVCVFSADGYTYMNDKNLSTKTRTAFECNINIFSPWWMFTYILERKDQWQQNVSSVWLYIFFINSVTFFPGAL